jgi:hypothetical protein
LYRIRYRGAPGTATQNLLYGLPYRGCASF